MNNDNVVRFKSKGQLAAEDFRDEVEAITGIRGNIMSHQEIMSADPDTSPAAIRVYQKYHKNPENKA